MKNTSERRLEILEYLCERRRDTVAHLAVEFGVCERTMRNDILLLSCSYPIYTRQGNDGGVFVMGHFQPGMRCLTPRQAEAEVLAQATRNTIFADEAAIERLVRENPSLGQRIYDDFRQFPSSRSQGRGRKREAVMSDLEKVREDLKDIRYYYAHKQVFERASAEHIVNNVIRKAERYNRAMEQAPPILFDLYVSLYIQNNTQAAFAYDRDYSVNYIKDLNNSLCDYIRRALNGQKGGESR